MLQALLQTVATATDASTDSLTTWVVGAVMAAVMVALGFLVRNAFGKVESTLEVVVKKLDTMTEAFARADGGPRWRGFNVTPREYAVGTACVPVEEWL